jgi:hypothetical protein
MTKVLSDILDPAQATAAVAHLKEPDLTAGPFRLERRTIGALPLGEATPLARECVSIHYNGRHRDPFTGAERSSPMRHDVPLPEDGGEFADPLGSAVIELCRAHAALAEECERLKGELLVEKGKRQPLAGKK